jgi:hypothetical protein
MKIRADREVLLHLALPKMLIPWQKDPVVAYEEARIKLKNTK